MASNQHPRKVIRRRPPARGVLGKRVLERTQCHTGGGLAGGVDEVGDAFGLGQGRVCC